ncbi:DUF736 domain-containing protein [Rhizobium indigoferae]|uniref:DUF736 family protein n=1 Tax=Rhizobium indigoferae TaxID=158891 RepID=A0ABZ1DNG3_9HYPH|nr:DUF736 family protein [Rhizobium indigoferae]NNU57204.1 DUF736 family protein [Rhizobium indigoferae]WRW37750.1 DUF736 family protein [Rhizobium indigoferae]GLR60433.1 hypothetical protein GCM10007919_51620 [Rhizobium indigoferae]
MSEISNFIRFNEDGTLTGNIASISYDLDIAGKENRSTNPDAPVYRLYAKSPRGRQVEIGAVWQRKNQNGGDYYSVFISTGHGKLNANLGRYPGQDDDALMAVIPWD